MAGNNATRSSCKPGYTGVLCGVCDDGYGIHTGRMVRVYVQCVLLSVLCCRYFEQFDKCVVCPAKGRSVGVMIGIMVRVW